MKDLRKNAIISATNRDKIKMENNTERVSQYYASYVFNEDVIEKYVSSAVFKKLKNCIRLNEKNR